MEQQDSQVPVLEVTCPECKGKGFFENAYVWGRDRCPTCDGAGYVPTEYGKRVLALLKHFRHADVVEA